MRRFTIFYSLAIALAATHALAQMPAPGKFLIASQKMKDADFSQSVILLTRLNKDAAEGLIVNRRSEVPVLAVFPEIQKSPNVDVWAGGPVAVGIRALLKSPFQPAEAQYVFADVSVISDKPTTLKLLSASTPPDNIRIYAGYVGWTRQRLVSEVARGLWLVRTADTSVVFDLNPETLWSRLVASHH